MSFPLATINGKPALKHDVIIRECDKGDPYLMDKPIHRQCTNVYQTCDGRWYHLHGSLDARASMKMMGVPEQDVTREEAIQIYKKKVAEWDSATIDKVANEEYRQAGVVCNTPEEFFSSEHVSMCPSLNGIWDARLTVFTSRVVSWERSRCTG
jgi:hypothetical protein